MNISAFATGSDKDPHRDPLLTTSFLSFFFVDLSPCCRRQERPSGVFYRSGRSRKSWLQRGSNRYTVAEGKKRDKIRIWREYSINLFCTFLIGRRRELRRRLIPREFSLNIPYGVGAKSSLYATTHHKRSMEIVFPAILSYLNPGSPDIPRSTLLVKSRFSAFQEIA